MEVPVHGWVLLIVVFWSNTIVPLIVLSREAILMLILVLVVWVELLNIMFGVVVLFTVKWLVNSVVILVVLCNTEISIATMMVVIIVAGPVWIIVLLIVHVA